jgi:glycosyltransferase involved in cell wall biosynthesis
MKRNFVFFSNTLWFLEKFKYELIKDISRENNVTCIYLRPGPSINKNKINELIDFNNVKFITLRKFIWNYFPWIFNFYFKRNNKSFENLKIIIFTIGPIMISLLFPNHYKKKTIYVLEGLGRIFSSKKNIYIVLKIIVKIIYKFLFNKSQLVFVLNSYDYLFLLENNICPIYKVRILPGTGFDHYKLDKITNQKIKPKKYIDYIGRILVEKGFYKFVLTKLDFQKYHSEINKSYIFRIITPEEDINKLSNKEKNFFNKLNIEIKPYLAEAIEYYKESKALIVPSYYGEGCSRVVLEASYLGIPILASKIKGIEEILQMDYKYFIESENPFSIANQLAKMINDSKYFEEIKEKQRSYIQSNFSVENSIKVFRNNL